MTGMGPCTSECEACDTSNKKAQHGREQSHTHFDCVGSKARCHNQSFSGTQLCHVMTTNLAPSHRHHTPFMRSACGRPTTRGRTQALRLPGAPHCSACSRRKRAGYPMFLGNVSSFILGMQLGARRLGGPSEVQFLPLWPTVNQGMHCSWLPPSVTGCRAGVPANGSPPPVHVGLLRRATGWALPWTSS